MEQLTKLSVGTELNTAILNKWIKLKELAKFMKDDYLSLSEPVRTIDSMYSNYFIVSRMGGGIISKQIVLSGFIEYYNSQLKNKPMERLTELKVGMELHVEVLAAWGNIPNNYYNSDKGKWISDNNIFSLATPKRTVQSIRNVSFCVNASLCDNITLNLPGFIEFYNKFYNLDTLPVSKPRPELDLRNLSQVQFHLPDKETQDKFLIKLFELGYTLNGTCEIWYSYLRCWKIYDNKCIAGSDTGNLPMIDYNQIINTNNNNSQTQSNEKIIVPRPVAAITTGQRPTGNTISGRRRPATVTVGHLTNQQISSRC